MPHVQTLSLTLTACRMQAVEHINDAHKVQLRAAGHKVLNVKYKGTPEAPK